MQPPSRNLPPPLPQTLSRQNSQQRLDRYSSTQSSANLLAIHPRVSLHESASMQSMQSMDSSESNFYQQKPASVSNFYQQQPASVSNFNQQRQEPFSNFYQQQPASISNFNQQNQKPNNFYQQQPASVSNFNQQNQEPISNFYQQQPASISNFNQQNQEPAPNFYQQQPASVSNFNQTNNYPQQQNYNAPQQQQNNSRRPPIPSIPRAVSMPNLQRESSTQNMQQTPNQGSQQQQSEQTFRVVYNGATFMVDPIALGRAALKFREVIIPYIRNADQMRELHLEVRGNQFTTRNMNNFLRLCQKLPTDVQNSEMEQICEIAKMFNAPEIYDTGVAFIRENIDPNFNVPDNKYDGSDGNTYLYVDADNHAIHHEEFVSAGYFDDSNENSYQGNYTKINDENPDDNSAKQEVINSTSTTQNKSDLDDHVMLHGHEASLDQIFKQNSSNNENNDTMQNSSNTGSKKVNSEFANMHSVIYQVRVELHAIKCPTYKFVHDNRIEYIAKQKYNDIYIARGNQIHIHKKENHVAHINQDENRTNTIHTDESHFVLKYVNSGKPGHFSINVSFPFRNKTVSWIPKPPRFDPSTNKYYLNFHGEYRHTPIRSARNIVLQNKAGNTTFIVRKMDQYVYEIECLPVIDPLIVFCIGLSDIVGPYLDPWASNNYFL